MRALLSVEPGGPESLVVREVASPPCGANQLRVRVRAAGINFPDALIIRDQYQYRPPRPFSPGSECAGVVIEAGQGVSGFKPGDRVVGSCIQGTLAEEAVLDAVRCSPLPPEMSFDDAAAFLMTYGTAYYALQMRARLCPGETVLVLGAGGGVGLAAVQLAKALGAYVVAAASSADKLAVARAAGAGHCLIYPAGPLSKQESRALADEFKSAARGAAHVVLDAVGGTYCEPALRAMDWDGRYLVVGFPAGIPAPPLNLILLKGCQLIGVFWGAFIERDAAAAQALIAELFRYYTAGTIRPYISARYSLEDGGKAIAALSNRKAIGKILVLP